MTIHFVYAGLPPQGFLGRLQGKASRAGLPLSYVGDRLAPDLDAYPFRAPFSITTHVMKALQSLGPVKFYDWLEKAPIRPEKGDILIGHPFPGDPSRVWNRAAIEGGFSAVIALVPLHHGMPEICFDFDRYVPLCDKVLAITGPYWWDTWDQGAFAHWKPKMTPVDLALDLGRYPRLKQAFNAPGQRRFLFIGNGEPYKGAHLLSLLFGRAAGKHECIWVGSDRDLPHLQRRPFMTLAGEPLEALLRETDIFITMGVSDANPTTILEAMAWGLPVACTPQSGYHKMDELSMLSTTDMGHNLSVLESLQRMPEAGLKALADQGRARVEKDFGFDRFTGTVLDAVKACMSKAA